MIGTGGTIIEIHETVNNVEAHEEVVEIIEVADFGFSADRIAKSLGTEEGQLLVCLSPEVWTVIAAPASSDLIPVSNTAVSGKWELTAKPGAGELTMTNKSGGSVVLGDVLIVDTGNNSAFTTTTTEQDSRVCTVALETISDNASGKVAMPGVIATVNVTGAVVKGEWLVTSTTVKLAKSTGSASKPVDGALGIALTAAAGPGAGTVSALILVDTVPGTDIEKLPTHKTVVPLETDYMGAAASINEFYTVAIGTGTINVPYQSLADHPGIANLSSSADANTGGWSYVYGLFPTGGEFYDVIFKRISVAAGMLSRFGLSTSFVPGAVTDGIYVEISAATATGKTAKASTTTSTGSTYTISAATWYRLRIIVNEAGTLVTFKLYTCADGVLVWTDTCATNIPTGVLTTYIGASAWFTGTVAQQILHLDYQAFWCTKALTR